MYSLRRTIKLKVTGLLCAACLILGCGSKVGANTDPRELWERVMLAKGGRERLHAVRGLAVSSRLSRDKGPRVDVAGAVQYEIVARFPDQFWWWEDYRPGLMGFAVTVWNRSRGVSWTSSDGEVAKSFPAGAESAEERQIRDLQIVHLLETRFVQPQPTRILREDRSTVVLEATLPGYESIQYTIDRRSGLPVTIVLRHALQQPGEAATSSADLATTVTLEGSVALDGIQMPRRVGGFGDVLYELNPDVDPTLFEAPPNNVTDGRSWRRFLRK